MQDKNNIYNQLSEKLDAANSPSFIPVLEALIAPEEAQLVLELSQPANEKQLATRLNFGVNQLHPMLEQLVKRGWLRITPEGFVAPPMNPRFMPHSPLPGVSEAQFKELWKNFFFADWRRLLVAGRERAKAARGQTPHRIMPARKALALSPNIDPNLILPYEDVGEMIKRSRDITINACACRKNREQCDTPLWSCMHIDWVSERNTRDQGMGGGSSRKHISQAEALAVSDEAEESGQVHIPLNTAQAETICNCCPCCCSVLNPVLYYKKAHTLLEPSRFRAVIDQEKCQGCQTCVERCYFDAIEMRKPANSKKMKTYIINEHCMGCGLCIFKCPNQAMHLELVRPLEHIPNMTRAEVVSIGQKVNKA